MRIRSIKPEFYRDRRLAVLPDPVRMFYVSLWSEADDDGWLRWAPDEIGADLYPYRGVRLRERQVTKWGAVLAEAGRLVIYDCGHAQIPTLPRHQHLSGHPVTTISREHSNDCQGERVPGPGSRPKHADPLGSPPKPAEALNGRVEDEDGDSKGRVTRDEASSQNGAGRPDVEFLLRLPGWKQVTAGQIAILDEIATNERRTERDVRSGWQWNADTMARTPASHDPIDFLKAENRRLKAHRLLDGKGEAPT